MLLCVCYACEQFYFIDRSCKIAETTLSVPLIVYCRPVVECYHHMLDVKDQLDRAKVVI